jgi:hypothetical protein
LHSGDENKLLSHELFQQQLNTEHPDGNTLLRGCRWQVGRRQRRKVQSGSNNRVGLSGGFCGRVATKLLFLLWNRSF